MQLTIYDLWPSDNKKFSWDDDINYIYDRLNEIVETNGYEKDESQISWEVWSHVPQYGFRLWYPVYVMPNQLEELNDVYESLKIYAEAHDIELSLMNSTMKNEDRLRLIFCTTFEDRARRKVKSA